MEFSVFHTVKKTGFHTVADRNIHGKIFYEKTYAKFTKKPREKKIHEKNVFILLNVIN